MKASTSLLGAAIALALSHPAGAANCPVVTVKDMQGLSSAYPQQFELAEFQGAGNCQLALSENPDISALNKQILGNAALQSVDQRLPSEPLVMAPYDSRGVYGGVLKGLSKATESGTSDLLSVRHVNLVRYADDLQTLVPNVAKTWAWNDDYTQLTFTLRKGHKWSDGSAFTAEDVVFWYNDIILNNKIYEKTPARWLFTGKPMQVAALDSTTVQMTFPAPTPGILNRFAVDYGQPFQPKHFLSQFMPKYNEGAEKLAKQHGFESAAEAVNFYYGGSDWKDVPSPLLKAPQKAASVGRAVVPTLESHIVVAESAEGRRLVSNPYFHMVDTAGQQLPYISEIDERYVADKEVQNLKIMNGEVSWKQQALPLEDFPLLKENENKGNYSIAFAPVLGGNVFYSPNYTHKDPVLREIFSNIIFRQALSVAINRDEINELVYLGQGKPSQAVPADPATVAFVTDEQRHAFIDYQPERAKQLLAEMGLKDADGDGVLERPDGKPLVMRVVYSTQGVPVKMQELIRDYWTAVGVRVDLKEVSSDEYRTAGNNNDLDVTLWKNDGVSAPMVSQDTTPMVPPLGDRFNPGTGFTWATWKNTNGQEGDAPPKAIEKLWKLAEQFTQVELGSAQSNQIGKEIVDIHVDHLLKIGIVDESVDPYMHHNSVQNVPKLKAKTYDYYWTYPYRPQQWWIKQ